MKVYKVQQKTNEWHELRQGKITGTVLKNILGTSTTRDSAFYNLLAERLSTEAVNDESAMERGVRMEDEAIEMYEKEFGVVVERVGLTERDDCKWIASSPDGLISIDGRYIGAIEVKCLSSANHIKAYVEQEIPKEYKAQGLQYFCVNDDLEYLYFVFYDDRISLIPLHTIRMTRVGREKDIEEALTEQRKTIKRVEQTLKKIILKR